MVGVWLKTKIGLLLHVQREKMEAQSQKSPGGVGGEGGEVGGGGSEESWLGYLFGYVVLGMLLYFLLSVINSSAQAAYQRALEGNHSHDDDGELDTDGLCVVGSGGGGGACGGRSLKGSHTL